MASSTEPQGGADAQGGDGAQGGAAPTVLVTRPADDAAELSGLLEAAGFAVLAEPLLTIRPTPPNHAQFAKDLDDIQALLFTSANGVRAFARESRKRDLPALCVGPATASAARLAGFSTVETADGDVAALAQLVEGRCKPEDGGLFHAAGSDLAGDLAGRLEQAGFRVVKRALYKAETADRLSREAEKAIRDGRIAAVVLFSPRTAQTFTELMQQAELVDAAGGMTAACLSQAVADRAGGLPWGRTLVAASPEAAEIVSLLSRQEGVRVQADETPPDSGEKTATLDAEREGNAMSDEERRTSEAEKAGEGAEAVETAEGSDGAEGAAPHPETPDAEAVIDAFGGIRPMANQLGVAVSTVQGWKSRNHIPENRWRDVIAAAAAAEVDLSRLTGGTPAAQPGDPDPSEETPAESPWASSSDGDGSRAEPMDAEPVAEPDDRPAEATPAAAAESATAPPPNSSPKSSPTPTPAAAQASGAGPAWLALLVGFIAVVGVATEPYWRPQAAQVLDPLIGKVAAVPQTSGAGVDPARIEALAQEIADLSGRVEQVAARAQEALQNADAGGDGVDPAALTALEDRLAALEDAPAGSGGLTPAALEEATAGLESRLGEIEAALASGPGAEAMQALRDRVAAMESRVAEQAQTIERVAEAPALKGAQQAAVVIAVGSVQDALAAGRPFEAPLERAAGLAPGDEALSQAIAALEPYAAQGVATQADLQRRFQASAAEMHAAVGGEGDWVDEAVGRLTSLVSVRQTGEGAERPPVSRAEAALARGDLSAAVAALSEIREASPAAARWLDAATARLDAEAAVERLRQAAVDRLTAGTEG